MTASYINAVKNNMFFINQVIGGAASLTWNDVTSSWDLVDGTWDAPHIIFVNTSKNNSAFTNNPIS